MNKIEILKELKNEYSLSKELAENVAKNNFNLACRNPEFVELNKNERNLIVEIGKAEYENKNSDKLRKELNETREKEKSCLKLLNLKPENLKPQYSCAMCEDTGFVLGKPCKCFEKKLQNKLLEISNVKTENLMNFSKCDFSVFSKEYVENIKKTYKVMQEFCEKFPNTTKQNVLFVGKPGTGKTFLLECVGAELIRRGFYVFYTSAFNLSNLMLSYHTARVEDKALILQPVLEADCLIIDDLGTEPLLKNVTKEYLVSILNERAINGKHTLISTNLEIDAILDRYEERIFSRIVNKKSTLMLHIDGEDLRIKRK